MAKARKKGEIKIGNKTLTFEVNGDGTARVMEGGNIPFGTLVQVVKALGNHIKGSGHTITVSTSPDKVMRREK